jgi:hypothetical protein
MISFTTPMLQVGVLAALLLLLLFSRRHRLPPGPSGNVSGVFTNVTMVEVFEKWRRKYGAWYNAQRRPGLRSVSSFVFRTDILIQDRDENCHRYGDHNLHC